ncbi:MAG: RNA-binding protein [Thermoproteota archaeon]|jgi:predicted RNA-binding Zn-ribbon protein involved in translation (DUF1610 family)|uniref:DUF1610 domain-containing protein n=1 Tax=Candidatus Methanodesulfokora washburnensis TaxID=2478471 RepID=A0A3R9QUD0_9CREN|nr:zinc finger domain-containing protein [Candidatus Methanodesulfokores washburnensis]RSN73602.1 DUF1610 domain-containing protein [Candidatus Methanodesulfokores washburnensis]RZN58192.1 MAG: DUF1610 domain-containing protein [Candidatus Methanodesulfokores washburnensis]TDA39858.1 MAG: RNA-binding protein [Candidatus Korarchaeota archaeon]
MSTARMMKIELVRADEELYCVSCGRRVTYEKNVVVFKCPNCGEAKIVRCNKCREHVNDYVCPACGFRGP